VRDLALDRRFPAWREPVIEPQIGREELALGSFAKVVGRTKLDFDVSCVCYRCIRPVEWTIGLGRVASAGEHGRRRQRRDGSRELHWAGRNTQIAAGSFHLARTATKSRSSSGTNSDVRAPDTVGTRASRR